ncbi:MAG: methyl-accepting chemotaxis protein, partial [Planctomycetes bacterium]|nr:methyl-accepting chemotaxis protein [Planctomycetota bacterium]
MKIRIKIFFITGVVFLSLVIVSGLSVWTINEISQLKTTVTDGVNLIADSRNIHGLMKDLVFDIFTPQTYRLLKDLIYTPRFNTTLKNFNEAVEKFKDSFTAFMESPRVMSLLRDDELKDEYDVAKTMSGKAFLKIEAFKRSLDQLEREGLLGGDSVYIHIQTDQDESLIKFFDEVRTTSYYFTNNFESFLSHFVNSLQEESAIIHRQILAAFWVFTACIGLFTVVLSLTFAYRIAVRIKTVEKVVRKISRGDFTAQLNISTRDEFGALSDNFNIFIKDLKSNVDSVLNLMRDLGYA